MVKIILSGCNGKMGKVIARSVEQRDDCEIVAGIDLAANKDGAFPVFASAQEIDVAGDAIIDFSNPAALDSLLAYAKSHSLPLVLCTTGFSSVQIEQIHEAAKEIPLFYSGNMSLGINLLIELSKKATAVFGNSFDVEIVEMHHNQKIDAPSGTALMIADAIAETMESDPKYVYDRHSVRKPRSKNEIGIHSVRGGTIVGEHEVIFAGHDEVFKLSHSAQSKEIFAVGSINASIFLQGKPAGLYTMSHMLEEA